MTDICFFDPEPFRTTLLPFTFLRSISDIRIGAFTIREKYQIRFPGRHFAVLSPDYLQGLYSSPEEKRCYLFIHSSYLPEESFYSLIQEIKEQEALFFNQHLIAFKGTLSDFKNKNHKNSREIPEGRMLHKPWQIFQWNGEEIEKDLPWLIKNKKSFPLSSTNVILGDPNNFFAEEGTESEACTFNTKTGKIYLGKGVKVMEGSHIRGPFVALGHSEIKMGTKIYGPTTIGPYCKVGGELNNVVLFGYSNKAHDGFIGNSVIAEWCNLGADTNCSNLKNTYDEVKVFSYETGKYENSGLQFCGLLMGDHVKTSINSMFNTGTVVGPCCNIFGAGFPPKYIPAFSWYDGQKAHPYEWNKLVESIRLTMLRRNIQPDKQLINALDFLYRKI